MKIKGNMRVSVGIIMGSDSDLPVLQEAAKILEEFNVPYEISIVSAHRTPEYMYRYATTAAGRGLQVIIAGAGGAAHLPGMTAALTPLPVIGVPVQSKTMSGTDSLYSIVQMPPGIPVATVAINGARNAGLLALKILALNDRAVATRLRTFRTRMQREVLKKSKRLGRIGYQNYSAPQ